MTAENDDLPNLSLPEQEALSLANAAIALDQARVAENRNEAMAQALNHNLEVWVAIRALSSSPSSPLPPTIRNNLMRLSNFVAQTTFSAGTTISDSSLNSLININMQLAEGLLEGQNAPAQTLNDQQTPHTKK